MQKRDGLAPSAPMLTLAPMDTLEIHDLSGKRSAGSRAAAAQWELALARLVSTGADEADAKCAFRAAKSPSQLSRLATMLGNGEGRALRDLIASCDESTHSLSDWLDALDVLHNWLEERHIRATAVRQIGYVACSSESAPEEALTPMVKRMLEDYGFDTVTG